MTAFLRILFCTACVCPIALGDDWAQWRGPARTGYVPAGAAVPAELPASPKVLWRMPLTDGVSSPVVAGGKVICLDNQQGKESVHAFDAESGKVLWSVDLDEVHKDTQSKPGPRCTPLVDGDRVYAQSCRGELKCLALADGEDRLGDELCEGFCGYLHRRKGKRARGRRGMDMMRRR